MNFFIYNTTTKIVEKLIRYCNKNKKISPQDCCQMVEMNLVLT